LTIGGRFGVILIEIVAGALSAVPSLAVNEKLSSPVKCALGV